MREIALHIMDIAENGINADATLICILVDEAIQENWLRIEINDNGKGIPQEMLDKVLDPFVTSRITRRVGLGLSLLKVAAERCEGEFILESEPDKGTRTYAIFRYNHIDRAPLGDVAGSLPMLIMGRSEIDLVYTHIINGKEFVLDTREIKAELGESSLDPMMIFQLTEMIREKLLEMRSEE